VAHNLERSTFVTKCTANTLVEHAENGSWRHAWLQKPQESRNCACPISPSVRLPQNDLRLHPGPGSADFCHTWVIPVHFSLTRP